MLQVVFVLEQAKALSSYQLSLGVNPGVGGTTYIALSTLLAVREAQSTINSGLCLYIGVLESAPSDFHGIPVVDLRNKSEIPKWDVAILTGGSLDKLYRGEFRLKARRLIAWIHHPYDWDKILKARSLNAEILSVGKAQYISNLLICGRHHHIDNIFCSQHIQKAAGWENLGQISIATAINSNILRIGFMGALVPSKGFHEVARNWKIIQDDMANLGIIAELHVIGGSSLYNFSEEHESLPCDKRYGDLITTMLGDEIGRSVFFYGTMGVERYKLMSGCQIAIVNPGGNGEAFPATILEWLALGIPVISSVRYGCADTMQYLPSLSITSSIQISKKIREVVTLDEAEFVRLREYCMRVSMLFSSNQMAIIHQWSYLLHGMPETVMLNEFLHPNIYLLLIAQWLRMLASRLKQKARCLLRP